MTPRTAPESRQFDFWIGHWTVAADGVVAGDSRVESILDGCALLEHWTGASGSRGKSLNAFNPDLDAWEQFWVDNRGQRLLLRGGLRDGAMVLQGVDKGGASRSRQRITWTANADGSVRQLWESSEDAACRGARSSTGCTRAPWMSIASTEVRGRGRLSWERHQSRYLPAKLPAPDRD